MLDLLLQKPGVTMRQSPHEALMHSIQEPVELLMDAALRRKDIVVAKVDRLKAELSTAESELSEVWPALTNAADAQSSKPQRVAQCQAQIQAGWNYNLCTDSINTICSALGDRSIRLLRRSSLRLNCLVGHLERQPGMWGVVPRESTYRLQKHNQRKYNKVGSVTNDRFYSQWHCTLCGLRASGYCTTWVRQSRQPVGTCRNVNPTCT